MPFQEVGYLVLDTALPHALPQAPMYRVISAFSTECHLQPGPRTLGCVHRCFSQKLFALYCILLQIIPAYAEYELALSSSSVVPCFFRHPLQTI